MRPILLIGLAILSATSAVANVVDTVVVKVLAYYPGKLSTEPVAAHLRTPAGSKAGSGPAWAGFLRGASRSVTRLSAHFRLPFHVMTTHLNSRENN